MPRSLLVFPSVEARLFATLAYMTRHMSKRGLRRNRDGKHVVDCALEGSWAFAESENECDGNPMGNRAHRPQIAAKAQARNPHRSFDGGDTREMFRANQP